MGNKKQIHYNLDNIDKIGARFNLIYVASSSVATCSIIAVFNFVIVRLFILTSITSFRYSSAYLFIFNVTC